MERKLLFTVNQSVSFEFFLLCIYINYLKLKTEYHLHEHQQMKYFGVHLTKYVEELHEKNCKTDQRHQGKQQAVRQRHEQGRKDGPGPWQQAKLQTLAQPLP